MATFQAIAASGEAILGLLEAASVNTEFKGDDFALYQASDLQNPMTEGISLYLYRISTSTTRRNLPPRTTITGQRFRPSLPLDLHYLLTAWAKNSSKQQRLLGWAMRVLEDTPILPPGLLNHYGPETATFAANETLEVVFDPLSLQDMFNIWEVLKPHVQLSVPYVARMLLIDSLLALNEEPPVQTRDFEFGKVIEPWPIRL